MSVLNTWEQLYQEGNTPWDQGSPCPGLITVLDSEPLLVSGKVAVPGCGHAHDIVEIARRNPNGNTTVTGLDIAPSAVLAARQSIDGMRNASVEEHDLFDLPDNLAGQFDWVWEHTCFCAIPPERRADYVTAVHSLLKEGGALLAIFYLRPKPREDGSDGPPFGCTVQELDTLFAERFVLERAWQPELAYPGREGREQMRLMHRKN